MTSSITANQSVPRRFWRGARWVPLGIIVLALVWFVGWRVKLARSVKVETTAIRASGLPVDLADLQRWPVVVPDEQNAALILTRAFEMLSPTNRDLISSLVLPVRGGTVSNELLIETVVRTNVAAMQLICGITNAASSRYPVNYSDGPNAELPHLPALKTFARLFACDALLKAERKDPEGAFRDLRASLKLSRSLDNEPILISQLVSSAILGLTVDSLGRVFARVTLPPEELSLLQTEFQQVEATNRLWVGMVGERASGSEMLRLLNDDPRAFIIMANKRTPEGEQTDVPPRYYTGSLMRIIGFWERDRNFFLRAMNSNIAALATTPPASLQFTNELNRIKTNADKGFYTMSAMLLSSFSKVVIRDADTRAKLRTAITAIAVERWRTAHGGKIPDTLGELVPGFLPGIPQDPYDGQPLRFKKLTKGYVVYSVGPNSRDDGGRERIPYSTKVSLEERNRYDITFIADR